MFLIFKKKQSQGRPHASRIIDALINCYVISWICCLVRNGYLIVMKNLFVPFPCKSIFISFLKSLLPRNYPQDFINALSYYWLILIWRRIRLTEYFLRLKLNIINFFWSFGLRDKALFNLRFVIVIPNHPSFSSCFLYGYKLSWEISLFFLEIGG